MRMVVKLIHPQGFPVELDLLDQEIAGVDAVLTKMLQRGYRPPAQEWPRGPSGNPLCVRHGVEMSRRSKQDDEWFSHKITTGKGLDYYCRGYRHGDEASDGFLQ